MILLPIAELTEGMLVGKDIRGRDNRLLLARGSQLSTPFIRLLNHLHVSAVYVEQEGTEDICAEDVVAPELRMQCQLAIGQAMKDFERQSNARHVSLDTRAVQAATYDMVEELLCSRTTLMAMLDVRDWGSRLFQHSVNTAILSTMIAKKMGHSEEECKHLAMGMIFHDCGQMFLPREVFEKQGKLSESERELIQQHTSVGFQRTLRGDVLSPMAAYVVLRHHERVDGTGYPNNLRGDEIHPLARIAAVVEAFDAMTSLRPYGRSMMPDQAVRKILTQTGTAFDKDVALNLVRHVAIYPTGSAVRLNTGERGIVVSTPIGNTTRPVVRLFFDSDGKRMGLADIDLTKDSSRHIAYSGMSLDQVRDNVVHTPQLMAA